MRRLSIWSWAKTDLGGVPLKGPRGPCLCFTVMARPTLPQVHGAAAAPTAVRRPGTVAAAAVECPSPRPDSACACSCLREAPCLEVPRTKGRQTAVVGAAAGGGSVARAEKLRSKPRIASYPGPRRADVRQYGARLCKKAARGRGGARPWRARVEQGWGRSIARPVRGRGRLQRLSPKRHGTGSFPRAAGAQPGHSRAQPGTAGAQPGTAGAQPGGSKHLHGIRLNLNRQVRLPGGLVVPLYLLTFIVQHSLCYTAVAISVS